MEFLELKQVYKNFGRLQAVSAFDLSVRRGDIHSLIGPNGAGKTTTFNLITGTIPVSGGQVLFNGADITAFKPFQIAQMGITRSFQQTALFMQSTVLENVMTGFHMLSCAGLFSEFFHTGYAHKIDNNCRQEAMEILDFMGLKGLQDELAGNLPHGHQRSLGVCIALACHPTLLLLDEPVTGMNPNETKEMVDRIRKIREKGVTIILVEHSMKVVMDVSDRITVLSYGRKIAEGKPRDIRQDECVIEAYLGRDETFNFIAA